MEPRLYTYRRSRGDAIEVYKYLHGTYNVDCCYLLPMHKSSSLVTLGHSLKLATRTSGTQLRQNSFSSRMVKMWNNLPEEVVMAPTVNCFKWRFDRHNADNRYNVMEIQSNWKWPRDNHPGIITTRQHMKIGEQAFCLQDQTRQS